MKKLMLIAGIVLIIVCLLSAAFAVLNLMGYRNVLDGSPELYSRLHRRMIIFSVIGITTALAGAGCVFMYFKK